MIKIGIADSLPVVVHGLQSFFFMVTLKMEVIDLQKFRIFTFTFRGKTL